MPGLKASYVLPLRRDHDPGRADPGLAFGNGKVSGMLTGLAVASHEVVVLADDEVRYGPAAPLPAGASSPTADRLEPNRPQPSGDVVGWSGLPSSDP